ncbi:seipin [Culex pipiens pallens]|uniref:seipin n=1 Tax=Culex pipiens pallens TaxID=42434 RepID=UPI0019530775|nr:seipin [Culex pipiens pallens]
MQLGALLLTLLDPFKIIRNYLLKPLAVTGVVLAEEYKRKTDAGVQSTKNIILRLIVAVLVGFSILWASIFMYAYFYYSYMPTVSHVKNVYLNYRDCQSEKECYQYPTDTVILTQKQQILMVGQPYRITLNLEMPESEKNGQTGMFTVCAVMHDHASEHSTKSCRLSMLHYRSDLLKMIRTVVLAPLFIFGYQEEKQSVSVDLFTHFEDSQAHPVTSVEITILSRDIQFYTAQLHISANFSGLRYLMFNWPILSAVIGIATNLFFILIVCLLSWYHWDDAEWIGEIKDRYQQIVKTPQRQPPSQLPPSEQKLITDDTVKDEDVEDISSFKDDLGLTS